MDISLKQILESIEKIAIPIIIMFTIGLAFVIFIPQDLANTLGIDEFRINFRGLLGFSLIIAISVIIGRLWLLGWDKYKINSAEKGKLKQKIKYLYNLTPEEKGYLIPYIIHQKTSVYTGINNGIMASLISKNIVYRVPGQYNVLLGPEHNIKDWAKEYLNKNQSLLDGAEGKPQTAEEEVNNLI